MKKIYNYFYDSYHELVEKVTWSSWTLLQQSTILVLVAVAIVTTLVWVMDYSSNTILKYFYQTFH